MMYGSAGRLPSPHGFIWAHPSGFNKLKDEHPSAGEVGNKVLSPLTCSPVHCTHGGGFLGSSTL